MGNDYRHIDARNRFRLGEAANLWAGHDPIESPVTPIGVANDDEGTAAPVTTVSGSKVLPRGADDIFQLFKERIETGDLPAPADENITKMTLVTREALETFARKMNDENPMEWPLPAFLFHKSRPPKGRRESGGLRSKTIEKWRVHFDAVVHFKDERECAIKKAAQIASFQFPEEKSSTIERDYYRYKEYKLYLDTAKLQNKN